MSQERDEELLREQFRGLREETGRSGSVPDFAGMMARARADAARPGLELLDGASGPRTRPRLRRAVRVGGWATVAAAAAVAGLLLVDRGPDPDEQFELLVASYAGDVSTGAWRSPTAGLLEVPGMSLTRSMPSLGGSLRGLDTSAPPPPDGRDS